jgi:hypothetical protein
MGSEKSFSSLRLHFSSKLCVAWLQLVVGHFDAVEIDMSPRNIFKGEIVRVFQILNLTRADDSGVNI